MFKFNLDDRVKDSITGFVGAVVSRTEFYNGCIRYCVMPVKLKDGLPQAEQYFDEQQLSLVSEGKAVKIKNRTGGPRKDVKFTNDVKRF